MLPVATMGKLIFLMLPTILNWIYAYIIDSIVTVISLGFHFHSFYKIPGAVAVNFVLYHCFGQI